MFGLSFLSPLFLTGLAAAAIPVAVHLFYRRAQPIIDFAAMRYLPHAPVEHARRRRVKEWWLLALRVAAVVLLALAFARPYLADSAAADLRATVVMIDTSASLSAPGQLDQARAKAEQVIRAAASADAVGVATFSGSVDFIAPISRDRGAALAALAQIRPGAGATRYRAVLGTVAKAFGDGGGRIVVVTDLQRSGWIDDDEGTVPDRIVVDVDPVDGPTSNLAITDLRVADGEAVATVRNAARKPVATPVTFLLDGKPLNSVMVELDGEAQADARLALAGATRGALSASVPDAEGYAADNTRYFMLDGSAAPRVVGVTATGNPKESFYLERALGVASAADGFQFRSVAGSAFSGMTPGDMTRVRVVLLLSTRGIDPRGRELLAAYLRGGGGVFLAVSPDVDAANSTRLLGGILQSSWRLRENRALRLAPDDTRHPVFRPFGGEGMLSAVTFRNASLVEASPTAAVLARYSDGTPALVEEGVDRGRALIFASDLNNQWNDFPLQPTFVPFVHEVLRHLAGARDTRVEYLVGELPGEGGRMPGVAAVGGGADPSRQVAVNVDVREVELDRMTVDEFKAGVPRQAPGTAVERESHDARDADESQHLWQYALLLMVLSLAVEGALGRRLV